MVPKPKKDLIKSLQQVPEELLWISNFNSTASIQTYKLATQQFIQFFGIQTQEQLREITHAHIIGFRNHLKESGKSPRTINNRLSALSSLFNHLIQHQVIRINPVQAVKRMRINSDRVEAKVLSPQEVRKMFNAPDRTKLQGLRDRAILGILFFTGARASEVCRLKVKDYYEEQGFWIMDFVIKGGKRNRLAVNQELQIILSDYFDHSGHSDSKNDPLVLPAISHPSLELLRHLSSRQIERIWAKTARNIGLEGTTPHSARATFITQALENNCPIEAVQKSVGHSQIKTTQMYDKRIQKYRESASFAVRY